MVKISGLKIELRLRMWKKKIDFEIHELLGEGSQGRVYKAFRKDSSSGLSQVVALKILHSETAVSLWREEFESLSKIRSPYCVQVYSFERHERQPALVLEFVDGIALTELRNGNWLEESDIRELMAQIEAAVLDLFSQGLFHGDLSPNNVLIDNTGQIRLLDFGTANGAGRLTPEFAAPERLCGHPPNLAADIFSVGRLEQYLYGRSPEQGLDSPYLRISPEQRSLQGGFSSVKRREQLALKIRRIQELRRQTQTHSLTENKASFCSRQPWSLKMAAVGLCFALNSSHSRSLVGSNHQIIRIHTQRWHYFKLNGVPLGYSPISFYLPPGKSFRLDWSSATASGSRLLHQNSPRILTDRDFSH